MPFPSGTYLDQIRGTVLWVADEFEQLYSLFVGYLSAEHNDDGTHAAITATGAITTAGDVTATGDITAAGDGTFDGDVIADADGTAVTLGADPVGLFGPGIQLDATAIAGGSWRISAPSGTSRRLLFRDELNPGDTGAFRVDASNIGVTTDYTLGPHAGYTRMFLGQNVSNERWIEVNAALLNTLSINGGQIPFPATQNPSADANTLDDYEEGTWTPVLAFGGASVGITYAQQSARYTKVGRLVTIEVSVVLTAKGSSTGLAVITGIPFSPASQAVCLVDYQNLAAITGAPGILATGSSLFFTQANGAASRGLLTDANFTNTATTYFSISYSV